MRILLFPVGNSYVLVRLLAFIFSCTAALVTHNILARSLMNLLFCCSSNDPFFVLNKRYHVMHWNQLLTEMIKLLLWFRRNSPCNTIKPISHTNNVFPPYFCVAFICLHLLFMLCLMCSTMNEIIILTCVAFSVMCAGSKLVFFFHLNN